MHINFADVKSFALVEIKRGMLTCYHFSTEMFCGLSLKVQVAIYVWIKNYAVDSCNTCQSVLSTIWVASRGLPYRRCICGRLETFDLLSPDTGEVA